MLKRILNRKNGVIILLLSLFILAAVSVIIASDDGTESRVITGKVTYSKERCLLQTGKTKLQLALMAPAALDSLNFKPAEGDTLTVSGFMSKGILMVQDATWKGQTYAFRDSLYQLTRAEQGTWQVNQNVCIGCGLCVKNCPASTITLQPVKAVKRAYIDQTNCTGCNTCIAGNLIDFKGCPVGAIKK
jgi:ferredoxin